MATDLMATDPALAAFLALDDGASDGAAMAAYADARAETLGLILPPETRDGALENLALLRRQTAAFVAGFDLAASDAPETFEP
jgi:hypothetical protein